MTAESLPMMDCATLVVYLSDYIDRNLDEALLAAAHAHLATCQNCRVVLNTTEQTILLYRERGEALRLPLNRESATFARIAAAFDALASADST